MTAKPPRADRLESGKGRRIAALLLAACAAAMPASLPGADEPPLALARFDADAISTPAASAESSRATPAGRASAPVGEQAAVSGEPATPKRQPSRRYRVNQLLLPVGVFLMAMVILGFLAVSALFAPPFWAWFLYLFLLPFLVWLPGWTLHPAAGWALAGAWLVAFPLLRRWLYATPAGRQWLVRQRRRLARFEGGDPSAAGWRIPWSSSSRRSAGGSRATGTSSTFSGQ